MERQKYSRCKSFFEQQRRLCFWLEQNIHAIISCSLPRVHSRIRSCCKRRKSIRSFVRSFVLIASKRKLMLMVSERARADATIYRRRSRLFLATLLVALRDDVMITLGTKQANASSRCTYQRLIVAAAARDIVTRAQTGSRDLRAPVWHQHRHCFFMLQFSIARLQQTHTNIQRRKFESLVFGLRLLHVGGYARCEVIVRVVSGDGDHGMRLSAVCVCVCVHVFYGPAI